MQNVQVICVGAGSVCVQSLTRKMNNAYIEDKQTQVALAEFEAKHGLALQPSEGALAEQEETWESGFVMLGSDTHPPPLPPPPPLPAVDHIALRQVRLH